VAPVTDNILSRIGELFPHEHRERVAKILETECGNNLPFLEKADSHGLERYQLAALQLSQGTLEGLREAVELAKTDWRDLLVAADKLEKRTRRGA
jgi:hypothetical protein